ncbi:MAG: amino acid transporter [Pararhizobium sp.]
MEDVDTTRHNERAKLTAVYFNGIAIALLTIGGFAPSISYISSSGGAASLLSMAVTFAACFAMSVALHQWHSKC